VADYVQRIRALIGSGEVLQLPSVSVAIRDAGGRVLLARHVEGNRWLLPGGGVEPGETPADAAVREAWEETGLVVHLTRLVGVFGGPHYVVHYRNGDRASYVSCVFEAAIDGGKMQPDGTELRELRFVSESETSALTLAAWVPEVLAAVFGGTSATFRPPEWRPPAS
jgi:8-oxo-dGTP pyrophosphatase MutT (NUDIX family)